MLALSAEAITPEEISALRLEIDGIAEEAPNVSDKVWSRIEKKLG